MGGCFVVIKEDIVIEKLTGTRTRKLYICLPESYEEDEMRRYPVMNQIVTEKGTRGTETSKYP